MKIFNRSISYITSKYAKLRIKHKMMLTNSVILFLVVFILGIVVFIIYHNTVTKELSKINLRDVKIIGQNFDYIQKDVEEMSNIITSDNIVQKIIRYSDDEVKLHFEDINYVKYLLNNLLVAKDYINFISIHTDNGFQYYSSTDSSTNVPNYDTLITLPFYEKAYNLKGAPTWLILEKGTTPLIIDNQNDKLTMIRTVLKHNDYSTKALVNISMNIDSLTKIYQGSLDIEGSAIMLLSKECTPIIYDYNAYESIPLNTVYNDLPVSIYTNNEGTMIYKYEHKKYLITFTTLNTTGIKLIQVLPFSKINNGSNIIVIFLLFSFLIALLIGLFFTNYTSTLLTKPIKNLVHSMSKVKKGKLEQYVEVTHEDEIALLSHKYNEMLSKINTLVNKVYVLEIEEKIAELSALQAQINPHFLYNTLDTIYWKAVAGDNKNVQTMIHALSKMFRKTLNIGNEFSLISQEKEFIEHYFLLQKMRYKNRLRCVIDFNNNIRDYQIPKLILQPFVENAIVHGIEPTDKETTVLVKGFMDNDRLHFIIQDNGFGMEKSVLNQILNSAPHRIDETNSTNSTAMHGYGIKNIIKRLALYFDNDYTLTIESELNKGTTVNIIIPIHPSLTIRKAE